MSTGWPERTPFIKGMVPHIQVQGVLYNHDPESLVRSVRALARAAEISMAESGTVRAVSLALGDSSALRCLEDGDVEELRRICEPFVFLTYTWFATNLGSARGHNTLAKGSDADLILLTNPDIVMAPRTLDRLVEPFGRTAVGMTEAKQVPLEHPKHYDPGTGETSWASGACSMIPRVVFEELGGYDADTFFLYCDDVDLSWRVRQLGLRIVHQPAAAVFHDKRVDGTMAMSTTAAERYYSAEAAILLAHKWSRPDLVDRILADFDAHGGEDHKKAAAAFRVRHAEDRLPEPIDADHTVAQFVDGNYAPHRF